MNKAQIIEELKKTASLSTSEATKLIEERIAMLTAEETRKTAETKLKVINDILNRYEK